MSECYLACGPGGSDEPHGIHDDGMGKPWILQESRVSRGYPDDLRWDDSRSSHGFV